MDDLKLGVYQHYRGKLYEVMGSGIHSETLERHVFYRALYDSGEFGNNAFWVRPLEMFFDDVEIDKEKVPRFKYIGRITNHQEET